MTQGFRLETDYLKSHSGKKRRKKKKKEMHYFSLTGIDGLSTVIEDVKAFRLFIHLYVCLLSKVFILALRKLFEL